MDFRPSTETIGMVLDVSGVTMYAMLAIWAAASRRYWFLRACVVGALLLIVLVIPAHDLLVQFLAVHLLVVSGVTPWADVELARCGGRRAAGIPAIRQC